MAETRFMARYKTNDAAILGLGALWRKDLRNGDALDVALAWRDTRANHRNGTYTSASLRTEYELGRPVGPVRLSAGEKDSNDSRYSMNEVSLSLGFRSKF